MGTLIQIGDWWLTVASLGGRCESCDALFEKGGDVAYRHDPKSLICVACADGRRIAYSPSKKWLAKQADERRAERERQRQRQRQAELFFSDGNEAA
jgi:hypothetical protein